MRGLTYPSHYPDNCPPSPYTDLPDYYHRMVKKPNMIRKKDFKSVYERNKKGRNNINECELRAISLFKDIEDAINVLKQFPAMPYRHIAKIYLPGNHGVVHHTPNSDGNSHNDWWIPCEIDPTSFQYKITGPY